MRPKEYKSISIKPVYYDDNVNVIKKATCKERERKKPMAKKTK